MPKFRYFTGAKLNWADFKNANCESANFAGTNLSHARFENANCRSAYFKDAKGCANFKDADIAGVILTSAMETLYGGRKISFGSDAHRTNSIAYNYDKIAAAMKEIGFEGFTRYVNREPELVKF